MTLECIPCGRRETLWTIPTPLPPCKCGANEWRNVDSPTKIYPITVQDKRFLKSLHVEPYDEEPRRE